MKSRDFNKIVKDYFSFTRSERRGMIFLVLLLVTGIVLNLVAGLLKFEGRDGYRQEIDPEELFQTLKADTIVKRWFLFDPNTIPEERLDSLDLPRQMKTNLLRYRQKGGYFKKPEDIGKLYGMNDSLLTQVLPYIRIRQKMEKRVYAALPQAPAEVFEFDPNTVSDEELKQLGFNTFQRKNLLSYRSRGGKFRRKTDILKVYGVDSLLYLRLEKQMNIMEQEEETADNSLRELIELNLADSVSLLSLPGIGPVFAGRIVRYREILGGFHAAGQLGEVYGFTGERLAGLASLVTVDTSLLKPLRVNFADEKSLSRHPYISAWQAGRIVSLRSANGPFERKEQLLENQIFDLPGFLKVKPYLTCR